MIKTSHYGWKRSLPWPVRRAKAFKRPFSPAAGWDVPLDWRSMLPPAYDQGQEGSCVPHGTIAALQFLQKQQGEPLVMLSRNFLYWNGRAREDTLAQDAGMEIKDAVLSCIVEGVCPEDQWAYDVNAWDQQPPQRCYDAAVKFEVLDYQSVDNTVRNDMLAALSLGPIIIGFSVASSFESAEVARTGIYTPKPTEDIEGGHCVLIVGSDPAADRYICRNSWGESWGMNGHFTVPRPTFEDPDVADDAWRLCKVT